MIDSDVEISMVEVNKAKVPDWLGKTGGVGKEGIVLTIIVETTIIVVPCPPGMGLVIVSRILDVVDKAVLVETDGGTCIAEVVKILVIMVITPPGMALVGVVKTAEV